MKTTSSLICLSIILVTGCAHHRDVRPGADGVHRVLVVNESKEDGARDAMSQAQDYCETKKLSAAVVSEDVKYIGDVDESTYKTGKRASDAAKVLGGAGYVFGGKNERTAGGLVGIGGAVADAALGKGYQTEIKFKCQ